MHGKRLLLKSHSSLYSLIAKFGKNIFRFIINQQICFFIHQRLFIVNQNDLASLKAFNIVMEYFRTKRRAQQKQYITLFNLFQCSGKLFAVKHLSKKRHIRTDHASAHFTVRNFLCLSDIINRICFSASLAMIVINTSMKIDHVFTSAPFT